MIYKDSEINALIESKKHIPQLIEVDGYYYHVCEIRIMTKSYLSVSISFKANATHCWAMYVRSLNEARTRLGADLDKDPSLKNILRRDKIPGLPEPEPTKKRPDYLKLVK